MDRGFGGFGKPPEFDGKNFAHWKVKMQAHLSGVDWRVWEIVEDQGYEVLAARVGQEQIDQHNANNRARSILFSSLKEADFERVSDCKTAREIWNRLASYHEGSQQVKNRLFETYKREYDSFIQLDGESVDSLFARFQVVVNKMRANKSPLPFDDHDQAMKLLYALDRKIWEVKVSAIMESASFDTLTVDELFSKLKSTEIDHQIQDKLKNPTAPSMVLVGKSGSSSFSNPSLGGFALSSLVTVTEDQLDVLGDDELALIISRFSRFHNNRMNRRRGGAKEGCFGCGEMDHFIATCPKKKMDKYHSSDKHTAGKYDYGKHKERKHGKHKEKKSFDKEALKKRFYKKSKAQERAFLASLSDLDESENEESSSSDEEHEGRVEDKLNGLCFVGAEFGGFCTMALDGETTGANDSTPEVDEVETPPTLDSLIAENESLSDALLSQDKLLKRAAKDRKEYKEKLEIALHDLEFARASVKVTDETECDSCAVHMSSLVSLQSKYACLLDDYDALKSKPVILPACMFCPGLRADIVARDARIVELEKARAELKCAKCEALEFEVTSCRHAKAQTEEENTYLRSVLSWVSSSEPQLGMMISQFKRGTDTSGLGFASGGKGAMTVSFGKVGESSGLKASEKPTPPLKLIKMPPPKPTKPVVKDGVFEEPPRVPPPKQVWIPKPNHLRNPLDTLPGIPSEPLPKSKQPPPKVNHTHKRVTYQAPKREVRYHCEYCKRDGHLAEFCFRRKRDERREHEWNNRNAYRPPHGVYDPPVQRRTSRPRGTMPQGARPQVARPRGGRARRSLSRERYDLESRVSGFGSPSLSTPRFGYRGSSSPFMGQGLMGMYPNSFGQMGQHWFPSHFANPSVVPYAHSLPFY